MVQRDEARDIVKLQIRKQMLNTRLNSIEETLVLVMYHLNKEFKFGKQRLQKLTDLVFDDAEKSVGDSTFLQARNAHIRKIGVYKNNKK